MNIKTGILAAAAGITLDRYYAELDIRSTATLRRPSRLAKFLPRLGAFDFGRFVDA